MRAHLCGDPSQGWQLKAESFSVGKGPRKACRSTSTGAPMFGIALERGDDGVHQNCSIQLDTNKRRLNRNNFVKDSREQSPVRGE